jgi:hypothetical protein
MTDCSRELSCRLIEPSLRKPVAVRCWRSAAIDTAGSRSPASCSMMKRSNGLSALSESVT